MNGWWTWITGLPSRIVKLLRRKQQRDIDTVRHTDDAGTARDKQLDKEEAASTTNPIAAVAPAGPVAAPLSPIPSKPISDIPTPQGVVRVLTTPPGATPLGLPTVPAGPGGAAPAPATGGAAPAPAAPTPADFTPTVPNKPRTP